MRRLPLVTILALLLAASPALAQNRPPVPGTSGGGSGSRSSRSIDSPSVVSTNASAKVTA